MARVDSAVLDESAHFLLPVSGNSEGPGGLLVCGENGIEYRDSKQALRLRLPLRHENLKPNAVFVLTGTAYRHAKASVLLQSEYGDLYQVHFARNDKGEVTELVAQYFDTIPPANCLCVLNKFLFSASEFGDHGLYQFVDSVGSEATVVRSSSRLPADETVCFNPRKLEHLALLEEVSNSSLISQLAVEDLQEEGWPQIYGVCGRAERSVLRIWKREQPSTTVFSVVLPSQPLGMWPLKKSRSDICDSYLVVGYESETKIYNCGDNFTEVKHAGMDVTQPTVHMDLLADNSIVHVCPNSIRHMLLQGKVAIWKTPGHISHATSTPTQLVVSLLGGDIVYFELKPNGDLAEVDKRHFEVEIVCLDICSGARDKSRGSFLAIGAADKTLKVVSLDSKASWQSANLQMLPTIPQSLCFQECKGSNDSSKDALLQLNVGLANGNVLRFAVSAVTGALNDPQTRRLGTRPVSLAKGLLNGSASYLALSSRTWLSYLHGSKQLSTPLASLSYELACGLSTEQCPEGIVGVVKSTLHFIRPTHLGQLFAQTILPLNYTPRKMLVHPQTRCLVILESDHGFSSHTERARASEKVAADTHDPEYPTLDYRRVGYARSPNGSWASCIRVVKPSDPATVELLEYEENEAALSCAFVTFAARPGREYLAIGSARDLKLHPRSCKGANLSLFVLLEGGLKLERYCQVSVEDLPLALKEFQGYLLAGVGSVLKRYDISGAKLVNKGEHKISASPINGIVVSQQLIFVSDVADSIHVLRYKEGQLYVIADDVIPRWITAFTLVDPDTVVAADKFENVFALRLPPGCDHEADEDPSANWLKWESGYMTGAPYKLEPLCQFHLGDLVTSIHKTRLNPETSECLVYGTAMGGLGALVPLATREAVDFFVGLETDLRAQKTSLLGRDHLGYRSYYIPVKDVIDGDLCEQYSSLEPKKALVVSSQPGHEGFEIVNKLAEMRHKLL